MVVPADDDLVETTNLLQFFYPVAARDSVVVVGAPDRFHLSVYSLDGSLKRIIRWNRALRYPPAERLEKAIAGFANARQRDAYREVAKRLPYPPYSAIRIDRDGNLWVQDYPRDDFETDPGIPHWTVFDPRGELIARVDPNVEDFIPFGVGLDELIGKHTDTTTGLQSVRAYALTPGSP
jgi:hypothetical protein